MFGFIGRKGEPRRSGKSDVKAHGLPVELRSKLPDLSTGEESGILGVAVICVDIEKNTGGEGDSLDRY